MADGNRDQTTRVCFTANTAWNLAHFRLNHLKRVRDLGVEVHAAAPEDKYVEILEREGIQFHPWKIQRRSLNPFDELLSLKRLARIYRQIQPQLVHHYTVKAVLYGTASARLCGVPAVVNAVTGLPYIIVSPKTSKRGRTARWCAMRWYAWSIQGNDTHVVVQNGDDLDVLRSFSRRPMTNFTMTRGSGVDLKHYHQESMPNANPPTVLFVGRLLREKGIHEMIEAIASLRESGVPFRCVVCGRTDRGNRSSVTREECDGWIQDGIADEITFTDEIRPYLATSDIVVLPSYREGTPRSLLEAMAVGRPIVTTDVPGCRETVEDEVNGLLVPCRDSRSLADAIRYLLDDRERRESMGQAGRQRAETLFDEQDVIRKNLNIYHQMLPQRFPAIPSDDTSEQPIEVSSESGVAVP